MARLVYYRNERELFKTAFEKKMSQERARIVFKKLVRHYKLGNVQLDWTSGCRCPKAFRTNWGSGIKLNVDDNSYGVLCHELAHIREYLKYKRGSHSKRHWRFMKGMIAYCEKKNYFETELERRLAPKPIKPQKPQPTEQELHDKKIAHLQAYCKKYYRKMKVYERRLVKTQKKLERAKKNWMQA